NFGDVEGENAAEVEVAVIGHVNRHAIDKQRHLAGVEAADVHELFAAGANVLNGHPRDKAKGIADVVAFEQAELLGIDTGLKRGAPVAGLLAFNVDHFNTAKGEAVDIALGLLCDGGMHATPKHDGRKQ